MKKVFLLLIIFKSLLSYAQNDSTLIIDNVNARVSLPFWLKAGQSIDLGTNTKLVSIIEFTISNNNLIFSQAISLTAAQTVPANKVWKIEGIGVTTQNSFIPSSNGLSSSGSSSTSTSNLPTIYQSPANYSVAGTYNWKVPPGISSICIEIWGGGGKGGATFSPAFSSGGGGGGGGYGYQCFSVIPGTSYTITVGGSSSVGSLISANIGGDGGDEFIPVPTQPGISGLGGLGGTSSATFNIPGKDGAQGGGGAGVGGTGGTGISGAYSGTGGNAGPESGGLGSQGLPGKVIIYW